MPRGLPFRLFVLGGFISFLPKDVINCISSILYLFYKPPSLYPLSVEFKKEYKFLRSTTPSEILRPFGIVVGKDGDIVVADYASHQIHIFSPSGKHIRSTGSKGVNEGSFVNPWGIAVDGELNIFVCDHGCSRIQVFNHQLEFLYSFRSKASPSAIAISKQGRVLITQSNHSVAITTSTGSSLKQFGTKGDKPGQFYFPFVFFFFLVNLF